MQEKLVLPKWLMEVKYNGRIIPNGKEHDMTATGANCQVFAYQLLRLNQFYIPDLRSSELWEDTTFSTRITEEYQALDVLFFSKTKEAYGAHIAVYLGENKVIHNAKKMGAPVIWELETFSQYPEYTFLLGGKRFKKVAF